MNIDSHGHMIVPEILRTERHDEAWRPVVTRQPNGWQMVSNDRFANGPVPREIADPERILAHMDSVSIQLLHFDTVTHWDRALEFLVDTVGAHRVVMGSDYPFDMGSPDPVRFVRAVAGISDLDKQRIGSENAIRLLKLDRPA